MNLLEACDKAFGIIAQAKEIDKLYQKGLKCFGEGGLRNGVMDLAVEAIQDEKLSKEVFENDDSIVTFLCGVWVQFLLVEVAGVQRDELKTLAQKAFADAFEDKALH